MEYAAPADLCQRLRRCDPLLLVGEVRRNHTAAIRRSYRGVAWLSPDSLCVRAASAGRRGIEEVRARLSVFRVRRSTPRQSQIQNKKADPSRFGARDDTFLVMDNENPQGRSQTT